MSPHVLECELLLWIEKALRYAMAFGHTERVDIFSTSEYVDI